VGGNVFGAVGFVTGGSNDLQLLCKTSMQQAASTRRTRVCREIVGHRLCCGQPTSCCIPEERPKCCCSRADTCAWCCEIASAATPPMATLSLVISTEKPSVLRKGASGITGATIHDVCDERNRQVGSRNTSINIYSGRGFFNCNRQASEAPATVCDVVIVSEYVSKRGTELLICSTCGKRR
jgi:hypothetical protein